jgi:DHA2 family multidrug resistance protein
MGASLFCGIAHSFARILVGRIVQGLGAGALPTVGHAILFSPFSAKTQPTAVGIYMIAPLGAGGFGPVLSAWLTDAWDWSWVFFSMAILAAISVPLALRSLPDSVQEKRRLARLDIGGLILLLLSLTTFQLFLLRGPIAGWFDSAFIVTMGLVALGSLVLMVCWELGVDEPVLNFRVLANVPYPSGVCLVFLWGMVFFCSPFLLPLYLQQLRGYPVLDAGLILLPQALVMIVLTPVVGYLYNVINPRCIVAGGMGLLIAGYLHMVQFTMETGVLRMLLAFSLVGAGLACLYTALTTLTMSVVPLPHLGPATSLYGLMRRVGANVGFALISTQVAKLKAVHHEALAQFTTSGAVGMEHLLFDLREHFITRGLPMHSASLYVQKVIRERVIDQVTMLAYSDVFLIFACLFLCGSPLILLLGRPKAVRLCKQHP